MCFHSLLIVCSCSMSDMLMGYACCLSYGSLLYMKKNVFHFCSEILH